jgi:hypothetical protein
MSDEGDRWLEWDSDCPRCGGRQWYDDRFDAFFCHRDDVWLEPRCGDTGCAYCRDRPAHPGFSADMVPPAHE